MRFLLYNGLLVCLLLCGCSKNKDEFVAYNKEVIDKEYYLAMRSFDAGNYTVSLRMFEDFSKKYPLHAVAKNSLQMEILLNYLIEKYQESSALCDMYLKFYPLDKMGVEYTRYMKIISEYSLLGGIDISANKAIELRKLILEFLLQYSNSKYKFIILKKQEKIDNFIVISKVLSGDVYFNANQYLSAIKKYNEAKNYFLSDNKYITLDEVNKRIDSSKKIIINGHF